MTQKNSLASEHLSFTAQALYQTRLSELITNQERKIFLPEALLEEIEEFTERNSLAVIGNTIKERKPIHRCCPQCLKAHIIKTAQEIKLNKYDIIAIASLFPCETGHDGYYLDEERLLKI